MATTPTPIDDQFSEPAQVAVSLTHQNAAPRLTPEAPTGHRVEAGDTGDTGAHRSIVAALTGRTPYDELSAHEQAVVRAAWAERMDRRRDNLDIAADCARAGTSYVGVDEHGHVVRYAPDGAVLAVVADVSDDRPTPHTTHTT